ncbi:hypothetical protein XCR_3681 [Xanthomonas campestris pv. raphani 756C]|nr:hypothetical protein XCR_3681 [Xanthomonas campestris pv. raphani 756C]
MIQANGQCLTLKREVVVHDPTPPGSGACACALPHRLTRAATTSA